MIDRGERRSHGVGPPRRQPAIGSGRRRRQLVDQRRVGVADPELALKVLHHIALRVLETGDLDPSQERVAGEGQPLDRVDTEGIAAARQEEGDRQRLPDHTPATVVLAPGEDGGIAGPVAVELFVRRGERLVEVEADRLLGVDRPAEVGNGADHRRADGVGGRKVGSDIAARRKRSPGAVAHPARFALDHQAVNGVVGVGRRGHETHDLAAV